MNSKLITTTLVCLFAFIACEGFGQLITPLDKGVNERIIATSYQGDKVFVVKVLDDSKPLEEEFEICVFNGTFWTCLPSFKTRPMVSLNGATFTISCIVEFHNEVYIAGKIENGDALSPSPLFYKFDGTEWVTPTQNINTINKGINKMVVWNDTLIAAGFFFKAGATSVSNIAKFDGNSWNFLGVNASSEGANNEITDLLTVNNELFISGKFTHVGGFYTGSIAKWVSNATLRGWGGIGVPLIETYDIAALGNDIAATGKTITGDSNIRVFSGGIWLLPSAQTPACFEVNCKPQLAIINNQLYAYGPFLKNGKSVDLIKNTSSSWVETNINIPANTHFLNMGNGAVCYGNFSFDKNGTKFNNIFNIKDNRALISGNVYGDKNNDCIFNPSETGLIAYIFIQESFNKKNTILVQTDSNGYWETEVDANLSYNIKAQYLKNTFNKPCANYTLTARANGTVTTDINLGFDFSQAKEDLVVQTANLFGKITPNNKESIIYFYVRNAGSKASVGTSVHANFDSTLNITNVEPPTADTKPGFYTWTIPSLQPGETKVFAITIDAGNKPSNSNLMFKIRTGTGSLTADIEQKDNFDSISTTVNTQTEVNFKTASKEGGFVSLGELDYGIYFTNTSPNTAKHVSIIDTLDSDLPEEIGYMMNSHNNLLTKRISANGVATWTFSNINLPSSEQGNTPQSSGFFIYRFDLSEEKQKFVDQNYTNTANIVFDYAHTSRTNTVSTTILKFSGLEEVSNSTSDLVYPVPATDQLTIENNAKNERSFIVYNSLGKTITSLTIDANGTNKLDVTTWSNGIYILTDGQKSTTFVVQH